MEPIRPSHVKSAQISNIPPEVIKIFNDLIVQNFKGKQARVTQEEAIVIIVQNLGIDRRTVFNENFLDVEDAFRAAGWKVTYDKPAYCESYEPYFIFTAP